VTDPAPTEIESGNAPDAETTPDNDKASAPILRIRYRIRFSKTDLLRWISHRDLARLWERLLRRAQLELSMTEGFHPKPRVGFPSALALGVESLDEVVEIDLAEELSAQALFERLEADQQPGLNIKSVARLPEGMSKAQLDTSDYTISVVPGLTAEQIEAAIKKLLEQETVSVERKKKTLTVNVSEQITQLELDSNVVKLRLAASQAASLRPGDVLDLLGFGDWVELGTLIRRVSVELKQEPDGSDSDLVAVSPTWETRMNSHMSHEEEKA
jgi:radical SAM-linked protein